MAQPFDRVTMYQFQNTLVKALYNAYEVQNSQKVHNVHQLLDDTIEALRDIQDARDTEKRRIENK